MAAVGLGLGYLRQVELNLCPEALRVVENLLPAAEVGELARDHLRENNFRNSGFLSISLHQRPFIKYPFVPEETYFISRFT